MSSGPSERRGKRVGDVIGEMGPERRALRARWAAVAFLRISAFLCLIPALASLTGYIPYAPGPAAVMIGASVAGFVVSVLFENGVLDTRPILEERDRRNQEVATWRSR
jgi:hypothetical protein